MIYTLEYIKKEAEQIVGDWNGSDERFNSGGTLYHEEDAQEAKEIVEKVEELEKMIKNIGGL